MDKVSSAGSVPPEDWLRDAVESIKFLRFHEKVEVHDAHTIDIIARKDGIERRYEGDFIKSLIRGLPALEKLLPPKE